MLNAIPGIGWALDFFFKVSLAIPFWIIWTVFGIGEKFFYFLGNSDWLMEASCFSPRIMAWSPSD